MLLLKVTPRLLAFDAPLWHLHLLPRYALPFVRLRHFNLKRCRALNSYGCQQLLIAAKHDELFVRPLGGRKNFHVGASLVPPLFLAVVSSKAAGKLSC